MSHHWGMSARKSLTTGQARKLLSKILNSGDGSITFTHHADEKLMADGKYRDDAYVILHRGQITEPAEWEGEEWRYRVHTLDGCCVVSFDPEAHVVVVTFWSKK